jgi:hypothetical protein
VSNPFSRICQQIEPFKKFVHQRDLGTLGTEFQPHGNRITPGAKKRTSDIERPTSNVQHRIVNEKTKNKAYLPAKPTLEP